MKLKKLAAVVIGLSCAIGMMTGCRTVDTEGQMSSESSGSAVHSVNEDSGALSIEAIQSVNNPLSLLQEFKTVSIDATFTASGEETSTRTMQYTRDDEGYLQAFLHSHFNAQGQAEGEDFYATSYASKDTPGAIYDLYDGQAHMTCYASDEYEEFVSEQFICWLMDASEIVESVENKNGLKVLKSKSTYGDESSYYITTYNMDPTSLVLQSLDVECFLKSDEGSDSETSATSSAHYEFSYDRDYLPEKDISSSVIGDAAKKCHLSITVNPGKDDKEVQNFDIAQGTNVFFNSKYLFDTFDDAKMKDSLESSDFDTSGKEATYFIQFTNK